MTIFALSLFHNSKICGFCEHMDRDSGRCSEAAESLSIDGYPAGVAVFVGEYLDASRCPSYSPLDESKILKLYDTDFVSTPE